MDKNLTREQKIEKAIREGHEIAEKIRASKDSAMLQGLDADIDNFTNFVDEEFGIIDDFSEKHEKYCELSFLLNIAVEEKDRHLQYKYDNPKSIGNEGVRDFENYLDSMIWAEISTKA